MLTVSYRLLQIVCAPFFLLFRLRIVGREHIPTSGGAIICPSHISVLDGFPIAKAVLPRHPRFFVAAELYRHPLIGPLLRAFGSVPVERGRGDQQAIEQITSLVASGKVIVIYPEGGLRKNPNSRPRRGAVRIALQTDAPLLPVALVGTDRTSKLACWQVRIGAPLDLSDLQALPASAAARIGTERLWQAIQQLEAQCAAGEKH